MPTRSHLRACRHRKANTPSLDINMTTRRFTGGAGTDIALHAFGRVAMIIWAIQIVLAIAVGAAGTMKLFMSKAQLETNPHMSWMRTFSEMQVKLLGSAEVLGAIGLIVPAATGIAPNVTRLAAACLAALMGGAVATHAARREQGAPAAILALFAIVVAAFR